MKQPYPNITPIPALNHTAYRAAPAAFLNGAPTRLAATDLIDHIITITSYLSTVRSASLPAAITGDACNHTFASDYNDWQQLLWEQHLQVLVNNSILAQAREINTLITDGIREQNVYMAVIAPGPEAVPNVIAGCQDVAILVTAGILYMQQLQVIANRFGHGHRSNMELLNAIIHSLNVQFNALEQPFTRALLNQGDTIAITIMNAAVHVGTEKQPLMPLVKGMVLADTTVIKKLTPSYELNATIVQLKNCWDELDEDTRQLAMINLLTNRLGRIVTATSQTITALKQVIGHWQAIREVINGPAANWAREGLQQVAAWAGCISRIQLHTGITQTFN